LALALAVSANKGDDSASFSAAGFGENLHKVLFTVLTAGGVAGPQGHRFLISLTV
jgi:hypothetical protein